MRFIEIDNGGLPQPSDFTDDPKYKTLRHLPFFDQAYKSTKEHFLKLNSKAHSFTSLFDIHLKDQYQKFIAQGGVLEDAPDPTDNPTNDYMKSQQQQADDIMRDRRASAMGQTDKMITQATRGPFSQIDINTNKVFGAESNLNGMQIQLPTKYKEEPNNLLHRLGFRQIRRNYLKINAESLQYYVSKNFKL